MAVTVDAVLRVTRDAKLSLRLTFFIASPDVKRNAAAATGAIAQETASVTIKPPAQLPAAAVPSVTCPKLDDALRKLLVGADIERAALEKRDEAARARLQALLRKKLHGATVHLFGSSASGLRIGRSSDVDLGVTVPPQDPSRNARPLVPKKLVYLVANTLTKAPGYRNVEAIAQARKPIVKCEDTQQPKGEPPLACDVVPGANLAVHNSRLLRTYCALEPRFRDLVLVVKIWASRRGIKDGAAGHLSSYAHSLTCLHFCLVAQGKGPILLDLVLELKGRPASGSQERSTSLCDGLDVGFAEDVAALQATLRSRREVAAATGAKGRGDGGQTAKRPTEGSSPPGLVALLLGYFEYMAALTSRTTYRNVALACRPVSPGTSVQERPSRAPLTTASAPQGSLANRGHSANAVSTTSTGGSYYFNKERWLEGKKSSPDAQEALQARLSVEDPFETCGSAQPRDVGCTLSAHGQARLTKEYARAASLLRRHVESLRSGSAAKGARGAPAASDAAAVLEQLMAPEAQLSEGGGKGAGKGAGKGGGTGGGKDGRGAAGVTGAAATGPSSKLQSGKAQTPSNPRPLVLNPRGGKPELPRVDLRDQINAQRSRAANGADAAGEGASLGRVPINPTRERLTSRHKPENTTPLVTSLVNPARSRLRPRDEIERDLDATVDEVAPPKVYTAAHVAKLAGVAGKANATRTEGSVAVKPVRRPTDPSAGPRDGVEAVESMPPPPGPRPPGSSHQGSQEARQAAPSPAYRCPQCWIFFPRWPDCARHLIKTEHSGSEVLGGIISGRSPEATKSLMQRCLARGLCVDCGKASGDGWTATAEPGQPYYCSACWKKFDVWAKQ